MKSKDGNSDDNTEDSEAEDIRAEDIEIISGSDSDQKDDTASDLEETNWKSEFLYLKAEFENHKKQSMKERSQLIRYGSEAFIRELLEILDNFDRALELDVNDENIDSFIQGMNMTRTEMTGVLEKFGVAEVESKGLAFDPSLHEALSSEETSEIDPGHIFRVFKKAYKYHDKIIRPAQVVVAKEPAQSENSDEDSGS